MVGHVCCGGGWGEGGSEGIVNYERPAKSRPQPHTRRVEVEEIPGLR